MSEESSGVPGPGNSQDNVPGPAGNQCGESNPGLAAASTLAPAASSSLAVAGHCLDVSGLGRGDGSWAAAQGPSPCPSPIPLSATSPCPPVPSSPPVTANEVRVIVCTGSGSNHSLPSSRATSANTRSSHPNSWRRSRAMSQTSASEKSRDDHDEDEEAGMDDNDQCDTQNQGGRGKEHRQAKQGAVSHRRSIVTIEHRDGDDDHRDDGKDDSDPDNDDMDKGDSNDENHHHHREHHQHNATFGVTIGDDSCVDELPFPGFTPKSFKVLTQHHWLRYCCLRLITWPYFERISMAVILLNCITLGMYQPCSDGADNGCQSTRCQVLTAFDHFIFAFFATEMVVKMIAMGVFGKDTYLAETWNRLDFFIVLAGSVEYAVDTENLSLSAIRTIRVLRPLRAINRIPSMRILVMLLLDTLPMLGNVLLLCFFVFFIFGIIGVQLWAGVLRHRCFLDLNASIQVPPTTKLKEYYQPPSRNEFICSKPSDGGMRRCENLPLFEYEGILCNGTARAYSNNTPSNESCVNWNQYYTNCTPLAQNPFMGAVSFDNIGLAWVVIFQVISLESWVNIMYYIQDAHSFWDWVYFVALIVIGSFFMINLCLVVIATQFSETKKRETERMMQERKRFQSCSTLASNSEPGGCYSEMLKLLVQLLRRAKRKLLRTYRRTRGKKRQKINPEKSISLRRKRTKKKGLFADNLLMDIVADKQLSTQLSMQSECETHLSHSEHEEESEKDGREEGSESEDDSEGESEGHPRRAPTAINMFQNCMKKFVESNFFQRSILVAILLNTLSMGVEYHNQPDELTEVLEYSNIVFCVLFTTEMAFKVSAYGAFGYISDGFNLFDGFIVILSMVELAQGGASGLSVLRTFRLLRILKLVRFMPALRRQLVVMLRTMDNVATFFALLVLFMFIFSILGMNIFGCKFCHTQPSGRIHCDRKNFDSLLWAIITVFQVLTQEDWNTVLYNGMAYTSPWASLYFIALMTFGNYVLFNLLVAILVEGFSTEDEEKKKEKQKEQEDIERQEKEKERLRLAENNNIGEIHKEQERINTSSLDLKNNKEKEKKMLALPPPVSITSTKDDNLVSTNPPEPVLADGPLNPPIITHTAATPMGTPMATPQGSPHESAMKDNNKLAVSVNMNRSSLSVESDRTSTSLSLRGSPRPSPRLYRSSSRGSQRSTRWLQNRRRNGDKTSLVVDSLSDSADDVDDDAFSSSQNSQSPTLYSPGVPVSPGINNQSDCNGHLPLNNQRTLSPQNSIKGHRALTPKNSIKSNHSWSRNNSVSSGRSICNSFELSRQNSFTSRRTLNSIGSGASKDEHRHKNLLDLPETKVALDRQEGYKSDEDADDPDAIDETDWNCSWCPEPRGCFLERHEYTLYILHHDHLLRKICHYIISRRWFDNSILFFIALNCITLAMERPDIPPDSTERAFLTWANYVFTVVFTIEMFIKVVSKGLIVGKHAYLKSGWNVMDGFLVVISLVDILVSITADSSPRIFGILRVFRLLRTLRPLRVISRAPGLKLVVQTLLSSLRPIGNIVLICCTFFIIFGILGVQLFKGTFYYCKGPNVTHIQNRSQCETDKKNVWVNHKYNFDNLGQALMALFVLASKDGWVQIMYTGLDAVGVDLQPIENYNEWRLLYFISFLLLVGFFVLNMFVGVVVENFHKCRESQEKEERAMRAAKRQGKLEKKRKSEGAQHSRQSELREPPYWAPYSRPRLIIHTVISSKYFDLAIAGVIGLNVISMAMEYYMMPDELDFALKIFNYFFTSVFILEAAMKIVALGFYRYIRDSCDYRWNQLDMMIVILSIVGIVLEEMRTNVIPINPTIIRVMRVLRIARVLKLLKMAKGIRALLDTVIQALPQVGNLGLLFFLLFFIFAALGVELFGRLECSLEHPCVGLSEHAHFKNFGMAFLTLFRVATGDNWNGIMKDTLREDCNRSDDCLTNCCVSPLIAPVYFVVFVLMAQFVLVNVVVAVLMKHLEEAHRTMDEEAALGPGDENEDSIDKLDEEAIMDSEPKAITENSDELSQGEGDEDTDCMMGSASNQPPSFTFSVRPPSEEQSHQSEDNSSCLSPARIAITMETLSTPSNSMLSPGLLSPASLSPASLSPASYCSSSLTPHTLSPGCPASPCFSEPGMRITSPPLSPVQQSPHLLHLRMESVGRRPLIKQYSMDMGYEAQLHHGSSVPNMWEKFEEEQKARNDLQKPKASISKSQPDIALPKADSLDSDPGLALKTPRQRLKQRLLRSRSSGAKYSRFKDKYKREKCGEDNAAAQPMIEASLRKSKERLRSSQCGSGETGSDMDDSLVSNWADEEAACDEEVKMITGEGEEDDDVHPTLLSYASSDIDDILNTSHSSNAIMDSLNSSLDLDHLNPHNSNINPLMHAATGTTGTGGCMQEGVNLSTCLDPSSVSELSQGGVAPVVKSRVSRTGSKKARRHMTDPGIDNSSFELGEEVRTPKCDSQGSLSGQSISNSNTPVVAAGSAMDKKSPVFVRRHSSRGNLPSPGHQSRQSLGGRSPIPGHPVVQALALSPSAGSFLQPPSQSVGGLLSPQSPSAVQDRLVGSPPMYQGRIMCSPSPHPHPLTVEHCDRSSLLAPQPVRQHPLASSPLPPPCRARTDSLGSLETVSSTSSSIAALSSLSLPPPSTLSVPPHPANFGPLDNLPVPAISHPLQLSPIPGASPGAGLSPLPSPSFLPGEGSIGSPKVRHRTLSSRQSVERDLPDANLGPV